MKADTKLIQEWDLAKQHLAHYKALEMDLRKAVIAKHYDAKNFNKGVNNFPLYNKSVLKYTPKYNVKLDVPGYLAIKEKLTEGVEDRILKWVPTLIGAAYTKLGPKDLRIMNSVITVAPGSPELKIHTPKK